MPSLCRVLVANVEAVDAEALKAAAEGLSAKLGAPYAVVLGSALDGKVSLISSFSPEVRARHTPLRSGLDDWYHL